jgi:hypothetical protein
MSTATTAATSEYVSALSGRTFLGVSQYRLLQLVGINGVRVDMTHCKPRYHRGDLERVKAEMDAARGRTHSRTAEAVA